MELLDQGILQLILNNQKSYAGSDLAQLPDIPQIDVPIGASPVLDGRGEEEVWQQVAWQEITRTNVNKGALARSRFKAVADRETLYLLVEWLYGVTYRLRSV